MPVVRLELHIAVENVLLVRQQVIYYAYISVTRGLADVMETALRLSFSELHLCVILSLAMVR